MDIISENAALMVVDVQQVLDDPALGKMNNPGAEQIIIKILERWRRNKLPIFHVKYISPRKTSPFHKDMPGTEIKASVQPLPGEILIIKHFESAFLKTDLEECLREANLHFLVVVGFYTDQCIAATVKVANNLGFNVFVVADATATTGCIGYNGKRYEAEDIHQMTLGSLQRDGIAIIESTALID